MTNLVIESQPEPVLVTLPDGTPITGITAITVFPVEVGGIVNAVVRLAIGATNVDLNPLLSINTLEEWAAAQGFRLEPIEQ